MPSEAFTALTDEDLGRIIGFWRTFPAVDEVMVRVFE
jgi:hypothetical protein